MTKSALERIVRTWQRRLRLEHWDLTVDWNNPLDPSTTYASTWRANSYDVARMSFARNYTTWSKVLANETIVHELIHLHERDLDESVKSLEPVLGNAAFSVFQDRHTHEREGVVDRLAVILVSLAGTA